MKLQSELNPRVDLINAVKTPLGFFALALLIVNGVFGFIVVSSQGTERIVSMAILGFNLIVMVALVAYFAYHRPEALFGARYQPTELPLPSATANLFDVPTAEALHEQFEAAKTRIIELEEKLATVISLRSQVLGVLGAESADVFSIMRKLDKKDDPDIRAQLLSIFGGLIDEGVIEPDRIQPAGYYRLVKKW